MACQVIATGTGFGNQCLSWVQTRAGLPHVGDTAYAAWGIYPHTSSPQSGDLVFFSPASINGNAGHVGFVNGDGTFTSVLSDGNEYSCDIGTFNAENGTNTLGYVSVAALNGKAPNPATSAGNAVSSALATVSEGGANWGRYLLFGALALVGLYVLDSGTNALADLGNPAPEGATQAIKRLEWRAHKMAQDHFGASRPFPEAQAHHPDYRKPLAIQWVTPAEHAGLSHLPQDR